QTGEVLFESGAIDPKSLEVDKNAHYYRAVFVNEKSEEADKRNPHDFRALVHMKVIGPGTADVVRYRITVPKEWSGRTLAAGATLKWRKFRQNYTAYTWNPLFPGKPLPVLPITDVAAGAARFPVVASAAQPLDPLPARASEQWVRFNDWGIGLLIQGDTRFADVAFKHVAELQPDRVDGWRNLARTALDAADGGPSAAV